MITIRNTQRKVVCDTASLQDDIKTILHSLGYDDFDIGIWLCSNKTMRLYNKQYRNKDKVTDILSFPYHSNAQPGKKIQVLSPEDKNLGDIIIAPQFVQDDLARWGQTYEQRMKTLLVHGICHLLGYDHIDDADYAVMKKKEQSLLKKLGVTLSAM